MKPIMEGAEQAIGAMEVSEFDRFDALDYALAVAKWNCLADPTAETISTWESWVRAMQVGTALFDAGMAVGDSVRCRIGSQGETKIIPATGPQEYLHAGNWLTTYYLAVICRENDRLDRLARVPVSFLRASGAEFDEYIYSWVEALQDAWFGRGEMWNSLVTAVNGTDPAVAHIASAELMLNILYPPLELFHRYQLQDSAQFNKALAGSLVAHKEYWGGDGARSLSGDGLVALGPLAIASMAYDAGMPIEVESEYLPAELVRFGWAGEIDT
ncbi:immunity 49 family protein [Streptomyces sp. NPDC101133]|uniref:immunity 49 family protein n=1 Tax=Streptomyces sp. NPDC101133 TaxID=3366111 RepID=UPI0037FB6657